MPSTTTSLHLLIFTIGALSLAAIYHTMLYLHRKDMVLRSYCTYLWVLLLYLLYRLYFGTAPDTFHFDFLKVDLDIDLSFMMITYIAYIGFWGKALLLTKEESPLVWKFYSTAFPLIFIYILWENVYLNLVELVNERTHQIIYILVRVYLSCFGFSALIYMLKQRGSVYYYYLQIGTIAIISAGLLSTYVELAVTELFGIKPFGWMMFGYFLDAVFFSAAIAYRLKEEARERLAALSKVIEQQQTIQKIELEKLQAIYIAREQERSRISTEIHDDLGSTVSAISFLSASNKSLLPFDNATILNKISSYSSELLQKMGEIVWALNTKNDVLDSLIAYIRAQSAQMMETAGMHYTIDVPKVIPALRVSGGNRRHIHLFTKEALHNVIKHSGATDVYIGINLSDTLTITVKDNGKGIEEEKLQSLMGNGLANMRTHAERLGGSIKIDNKGGTCITFTALLLTISNESVI